MTADSASRATKLSLTGGASAKGAEAASRCTEEERARAHGCTTTSLQNGPRQDSSEQGCSPGTQGSAPPSSDKVSSTSAEALHDGSIHGTAGGCPGEGKHVPPLEPRETSHGDATSNGMTVEAAHDRGETSNLTDGQSFPLATGSHWTLGGDATGLSHRETGDTPHELPSSRCGAGASARERTTRPPRSGGVSAPTL